MNNNMEEITTRSQEEGIPVLDAELARDLEAWMRRYVIVTDDQAKILSYWIIHTWSFESAATTPYLYIFSQDTASGKTRLLEILDVIARNAKRADDMTANIMFKLIERERPTLLWDEVDTVWSGSRNESKRRIMNTGYKMGGSAWREAARDLVEYTTFAPKALAGLRNGFLPVTVADRCIPVEMRRKMADDHCERFISRYVENSAEVEDLRSRLERFAEDRYLDLMLVQPVISKNLSDRQNEISEPLLAIAAVFADEQSLLEALERTFKIRTKMRSPQEALLRRMKFAFGDEDRMFTDELCERLGRSFNGHVLARVLAPLGITPSNIRKGKNVRKGYLREQFAEFWGSTPSASDDEGDE